jgi:hypothetical protein
LRGVAPAVGSPPPVPRWSMRLMAVGLPLVIT